MDVVTQKQTTATEAQRRSLWSVLAVTLDQLLEMEATAPEGSEAMLAREELTVLEGNLAWAACKVLRVRRDLQEERARAARSRG